MKKTYTFIAILTLVASVVLAGPSAVLAQSYTYSSQNNYGPTYVPANSVCTNLTSGLYKGLRDVNTGGQVSALQSFLIAQRYLPIIAPTGYYGVLTAQAVMQYQQVYQIPADGSVGVLTRASIQTISCGNNIGNNNIGYNNNYNNGYINYYNAPVLSSLSATSGGVGTSVTIYGSGFDLYNNTVNFNGVTLTGIPSYRGTALAFTVPQVYNTYNNYNNNYNYNYDSNYNYNYNNGYNTTGAYSVTVTTSRGTSNALSFTVTSGNNNNNCYNSGYNGYTNGVYNNCYNNYTGPISVSNVSGPTNLTTGAQGVWSLSLYNPNSNYVSVSARWGDENTYYGYENSAQSSTRSSSVQGQQTLSFTHTYQTSGNYTVVFMATDNQGANTSVSATVYVSGSSYNQGQLNLSSISPSSARVGTQVTLYGSGFATYGNNTVHFGNGGTANLTPLSNGTMLYFMIPSSISGCDLTGSGTICPMYAQQVTPGSYPVYVTNGYGQSNTLNFNVTY